VRSYQLNMKLRRSSSARIRTRCSVCRLNLSRPKTGMTSRIVNPSPPIAGWSSINPGLSQEGSPCWGTTSIAVNRCVNGHLSGDTITFFAVCPPPTAASMNGWISWMLMAKSSRCNTVSATARTRPCRAVGSTASQRHPTIRRRRCEWRCRIPAETPLG